MTTEERLVEICVRERAATPGPWEPYARDVTYTGFDDEDCFLGWEVHGPEEAYRGRFKRGHDANFIAHSREDVPWLQELVGQLQERVRELEAYTI